MKIQLVLPYCDNSGSQRLSGWPQPLGILSIATYLKKKSPQVDIEILDGTVLSQEEIESRIDADIVGITTILRSYLNALRIANLAKKAGSKVVIGGPYATALASTILVNQPDIDVAVRYDGEIAFEKLVRGVPYGEIENLVYRLPDGTCAKNKIVATKLELLPQIDRTFINIDEYQKNFQENITSPYKRPGTIYSQRGCCWRARPEGGCIFCAIPDYSIRLRRPTSFWREVEELHELGYDFLYDISDDIGAYKNWLRNLVDSKKEEINISFMHFLSANHTSNDVVEMLMKLGSVEAFIGFEAVHPNTLRNANKEASHKENINAVKVLDKFGLSLVAGFVSGIPGESKESLRDSVEFAKYISNLKITNGISWNTFKPLPGSSSYKMLLKHPVLGKKYQGKDILDLDEMKKDWASFFCQVDYGDLCAAEEEVKSFAPNIIAYSPRS
jgi:anaerobic magnesium-protoporphyrin IX monomethyl ester cyclase